MDKKNRLTFFGQHGFHKGFYQEEKPDEALFCIKYTDYFELPDDEDFPYYCAHELLRGSCHHFAVSLKKILGYNVYIIKGLNHGSFHAFCQIYKNREWYYVDARGITSSFKEFMDVAKDFVRDEYTIRLATIDDITEWENGWEYNEEAYAFAEALIEQYKEYYTL